MSYNLYAEGELDLFTFWRVAQDVQQIEVFPIPSEAGSADAIGIALPSDRADETALAEIEGVVSMLLAADAKVFDLTSGAQIASSADLEQLRARILR